MKIILFIPLSFLSLIIFGQTKTLNIRGQAFNLKTSLIDNDNGDPIKQMELYRNNTKLLTHIISKIEGDCNSESIELGTFEIKDSTMIFYSYWSRTGDAPVSPFGARKQTYSIRKDGILSLARSELYVETSRQGWRENKGIEYLFSPPKKEDEKSQLKEYIKEVEVEYNGTFILGRAKDQLLAQVKAKLKKQIKAATKNWKKIYG